MIEILTDELEPKVLACIKDMPVPRKGDNLECRDGDKVKTYLVTDVVWNLNGIFGKIIELENCASVSVYVESVHSRDEIKRIQKALMEATTDSLEDIQKESEEWR